MATLKARQAAGAAVAITTVLATVLALAACSDAGATAA